MGSGVVPKLFTTLLLTLTAAVLETLIPMESPLISNRSATLAEPIVFPVMVPMFAVPAVKSIPLLAVKDLE